MFMEASAPTRPGDKARLYSERFQPTGGSCIKFWYHMYGPSVGTLNVLVKTGAGNRSEDIVWTLSGNQLDQWKFGQAPVVSAQSGYQVGIWNGLYSGTSLINIHNGFLLEMKTVFFLFLGFRTFSYLRLMFLLRVAYSLPEEQNFSSRIFQFAIKDFEELSLWLKPWLLSD